MDRPTIKKVLRKYNSDIYYHIFWTPYDIIRSCAGRKKKIFNYMSKKDLLCYGPKNRLTILEMAYFAFAKEVFFKHPDLRIAEFIYGNPNVTIFSPNEIRDMLFSATFDDSIGERARNFIRKYEQNYKRLPKIYKRMGMLSRRLEKDK